MDRVYLVRSDMPCDQLHGYTTGYGWMPSNFAAVSPNIARRSSSLKPGALRMKQVTGGDAITARFLYQEFFTFILQLKIFLAAYHKPVIWGTDHGIWRRIRLIPFTETIPDTEQDKDLLTKLRAELPGILNWATEGCLT